MFWCMGALVPDSGKRLMGGPSTLPPPCAMARLPGTWHSARLGRKDLAPAVICYCYLSITANLLSSLSAYLLVSASTKAIRSSSSRSSGLAFVSNKCTNTRPSGTRHARLGPVDSIDWPAARTVDCDSYRGGALPASIARADVESQARPTRCITHIAAWQPCLPSA